MCGIYGSTIPYPEHIVKEKMKRIRFRGPDYTGIKTYSLDPNLTLAHNRLSIIDLDARSNQPFEYEGLLSIVYNGEIYNFKELKAQLIQKGYSFLTTSDTEVICASYLEYGESCLKYFNGMFSFVIYDKKNKKLFGARDRLGKKPLYYYHNNAAFEFSSQLSAIQFGNTQLTISKYAIKEYLQWNNIPEPYSIFNEIKKLPAGHYFKYSLYKGEFELNQYWDLDYKRKNFFEGSYNDALNNLEKILKDAIYTRLFADVPVGIFLSGGIDSSLVAALACQCTETNINTFSIKFLEEGFDESVFAEKVANHLGTIHHVIECNANEGIALIEELPKYYDEPFADASAIPSLLLAKHTRQYVKVALSGDGGDESFMGYHRYNWTKKAMFFFNLPSSVRLFLAHTLSFIPKQRAELLAKGFKQKNIESFYVYLMSGLDSSWIDGLEFVNYEEKFPFLFNSDKGLMERISDFDLKTYLNWDINTKVDRATMAFSLESRAPLMDFRIVEFGRSLPTKYKFANGVQKRILKDLLFRHVPKSYFDRPKSGFTMPFKEWFRSEMKDYVLAQLDSNSLGSIPCINQVKVTKLIQQHIKGERDWYSQIWKLLVLKQWLNEYEGYIIK